jgi:glycosyltransferase involved in cell wall biosynthesis
MKIGIINSNAAITAGGGVRIQGIMWHQGLQKLGHESRLINMWEENDWASYDCLIVLSFGDMFPNIMRNLSLINPNIVVAPIIDPKWSKTVYKFFTKHWGFKKHLGLSSRFHDFYLYGRDAKVYLTRSKRETEFLSECCDVPLSKIKIVPLSLRFDVADKMPEKKNFCFHCSRLRAENKNVPRLIEAAKKYNFKLKLAGALHGKSDEEWLNDLIKDAPNIEYVGMISDEELISYYKRCKVFALPSLVEGVGMVALEAAAFGAEIVLTNLGAPKEYWQGHATLVDPYSVDDIGKAVLSCLSKDSRKSTMLDFIRNNYSLEACSKKLINALEL